MAPYLMSFRDTAASALCMPTWPRWLLLLLLSQQRLP
jgi:hypothetical protein